ncbi:matrixin family metalloprotease [Haloparvum sedimenti]|uniref:matrixin family metalloprotease n=1 Tax=Haloparvum sedimenti TaxID=1678448 RepID=UPI00071E6AA9|nr:matrixin family metalloprotease [Haloparvum sedimenti]
MTRIIVVLTVCLLLAGCAGGGLDTATPDTATTAETPEETSTTATPTSTPTPTDTEESTERESFDPPPDNPWETDPIAVAIYRNDAPERDYEPIVRESLNFWENESEAGRVGYELNYTIVEDSADADIIIGFVDEVDRCGGTQDEFAGCADYIQPDETAPSPTIVEVATIYNDSSTRTVLDHEFGHTLGYTHSENDIYGFMNETNVLAEIDQPDISDREYFWEKEQLSVYVAYNNSQSHHPKGSRDDDVERVVDYYNDDDELPDGVGLTLVDDRSEADIVIEFRDELEDDYASMAYYHYRDMDRDGEANYYTSFTILVGELGSNDAETHVGYQMGMALYAHDSDEVPRRYQVE